MKKYITILIAFALTASSTFGQNNKVPCAFDRLVNNHKLHTSEKIIQQGVSSQKSSHDIKLIPVVVHIFHEGGNENISDSQVESAITVLNEDYGKLAGTNGAGNGVDTDIRFSLAKIDPNGNCTNGVVRINSSLTNHKTYERPLLKQVSFWDNQKYLNIYIVKSIPGGTLGYSSFPGGPADEDGLVVRHNYFGRTGTAASTLGRTGTHEVGHWLGIYHTFNNSCGIDLCTDGDYVCDTPPVSTANFGCSVNNSCSNDVPDVPDQIENYMDYTSESCSNMFTAGQSARMLSTLNNLRPVIWSQSNLVATGCDSLYVPPTSCGVAANFASLNPEICINNNVNFIDISLNGATSWQWYFTGGSPSSSTIQNPQVTYNSLGSYDVKLVVTNGTSIDSITLSNFVTVSNPGVGQALPFVEDFESGIFPPNGIVINNPDGGISWELDSNAFVSPSHSISLDNLSSTNYGTIDEIILPFMDLSSNGSTSFMQFQWAYAKSVSLYTDEMIVQLSIDCGATWTQIYYKSHTGLVTGPTQTTPFIPDSSQWKSALIDLTSYAAENYVQIKIMNVTDGGNFLYIDDISVGDLVVSVDEVDNENYLIVFPNPSSGSFKIKLEDTDLVNRQINIYNSLGVIVKDIELQKNTNEVEISNLTKGIYFVSMRTNNNRLIKKIIIQ
ncbi:MAG: PKD repeat protein [Flavobacteriales bacterium]|jgi:PKD repeat protein